MREPFAVKPAPTWGVASIDGVVGATLVANIAEGRASAFNNVGLREFTPIYNYVSFKEKENMTGEDSNRQIQGKLYIISAPSGAGKTSLLKALLEDLDNISVSVSHTTRAMRVGEENGVHYHFVDIDTFKKMNAEGKFLESAQVFDNYYGTSAAEVDRLRNTGQDVILEIDW